MKRFVSGAVIILIMSICAGPGMTFESFSVPKPKATIEGFDIESISLRDITFLFDVGISNPYPVHLKLQDIKIVFFIDNHQLFSTNTSGGFVIDPKKKRITTFRVNLIYSDIMKIIKTYGDRDFLSCLADVTIVIPLPDMPGLPKSVSLNFKLHKNIPAIKPSVHIANFKVERPTLNEINDAIKKSGKNLADPNKIHGMFNDILSGKKPAKIINPADLDLKLRVNFDIVLKNETRAQLLFNRLDYNFFVNSEKLISGNTLDIKREGSTSILRISNVFSSKILGKSILDAFMNLKGNFSLTGYSMLKFPDSIKKEPLKLNFDEKGDMSIR